MSFVPCGIVRPSSCAVSAFSRPRMRTWLLSVARAAAIWTEYQRSLLIPLPGVVTALRVLRDHGYRLGLISNCGAAVPALWCETAFRPLLDSPVFSCVAGVRKPYARIYRIACERLAVRAEDCLFVGDGSANELEGAARVGMRPVLVRSDTGNEPADARAAASSPPWTGTTIRDVSELVTFVTCGIPGLAYLAGGREGETWRCDSLRAPMR